ncbi:hypothetical protein [Magnetospirillum sp. 15-1]|uniref:hypothetical protein n=1 Tax=Magnetospirillum sp. 15-1 TaxID=1979370 RepID=UPI000BBC616B|nr:hypothetical protein [Magnetospirillum sp. 15-1]
MSTHIDTNAAAPAIASDTAVAAAAPETILPAVASEPPARTTNAVAPSGFHADTDRLNDTIQKAVETEGKAVSATETSTAILYGMIGEIHAYSRKYKGTDEFQGLIEARGIPFEPPLKASPYTPIVQALICPKIGSEVRMDEKAKPRWRTKVSKICSVLDLADHLERTDIEVLLTEGQDTQGRTGLDATCARWTRIKNGRSEEEEDTTAYDKALAVMISKAGTDLPTRSQLVNTTALVAIHHAEDGTMRVLGPVNGEQAESLLKSFVLDRAGSLPPTTQIEELLRLLSFAKVAGAGKLQVKIVINDDGTELWATQGNATSCVAHLHLRRSSLLPHGTYWLDQTLMGKLRGIAELRHYGAEYRFVQPIVQKDTTSFVIAIHGRLAAEKAYGEVPQNGEFDWHKRLPSVGERPTKGDDVVKTTYKMTSPKSVRLRNRQGWMQQAEILVDARIEPWITKTLGIGKGDSKRPAIAQAVNAGEEGNRMSCCVSASAWTLRDDRDATVAEHRFEAAIAENEFEEVYTFHSKDIPSAYRAIKTVLPDGNIKVGVFTKMLRMSGEHEGSYAEVLLPTFLRSGSRCSDFAEMFDEMVEASTAKAAT